CASSNVALMMGLDLIRSGRADAVLVSGASYDLDRVTVHRWALLDALAVTSFNDEPTRASRPFDARREGFVPGEGAAAVVLERMDQARARGAPVYAEVLGAASAGAATRLTHPSLEGQARVM